MHTKPSFKHSRRFYLLTLLLLILVVPLYLSGCGGGGGGSSSSSPTSPPSSTVTVSGQVSGGTSPIPSVSVNLYVAGDTNPTNNTTTDSNGNYSFSYTYTSSSNPILYVAAVLSTGHLISIAGSASNMPVAVNIDELSTVQTAYAINQAGESINSGGSINVKTNGTNLLTDFSSVYSATNNTSSASFSPLQYEVYIIANGLASAVQSAYGSLSEQTQAETAAQSLLTNLKNYSSFTCFTLGSYCTENMALNGVTNWATNNNTIAAFSGSAYEITPQAPYPMAPNTTAGNTLTVNYLPFSSDVPNIPYVTIYINGAKFNLLLDTGATGIMMNQSALTSAGITLPATSYPFSGNFGSGCTSTGAGFSGNVTYGEVSTAPTGGLSTSPYFPIAVTTTNCDSYGLGLDGDFGMGLSPYYTFGHDGVNSQPIFVPSVIYGFSQNYNNGFLLNILDANFNSNGYDNSSSAGAGSNIIFGLNTETNNTLKSGSVFFPDDGYALGIPETFPLIYSQFGAATIDPSTSSNYLSYFDTGSNFMFMGSNALSDAINNFNSSTMVYNCSSTTPVLGYSSTGNWNILIGGLSLPMYFESSSGSYLGNTYPTYPAYNGTTDTSASDSICNLTLTSTSNPALDEYYVLDKRIIAGQEDFGLPFMFNQTLYWQVSPWGLGAD